MRSKLTFPESELDALYNKIPPPITNKATKTVEVTPLRCVPHPRLSEKMKLPDAMLTHVDCTTGEEAWKLADFPGILQVATENRLACIGGQFQFRGPFGTAEMYWLNTDSSPRLAQEAWSEYVGRANDEVRLAFDRICSMTDFDAEASRWEHIAAAAAAMNIGDPKEYLYVVAYFESDPTGS